MYSKILVPLDGSRLGTKAINHACEIALKFSSEVILLQVVKPNTPITVAEPMGMEGPITTEIVMKAAALQDKKNMENARRYLRIQLKKFTDKGINSSYDVIMGRPAETILKYCHKNKIDLVIMTTHGRSGIKRAIMGSVADAVVREKGVPVLVVRI